MSKNDGNESNARQQFLEEMSGVRPMRKSVANLKKKRELTPGQMLRRELAVGSPGLLRNPLTDSEHIEMLTAHDVLEFKRPGIQHGVYRNLRLGKYPIDARLDLHNLTVDAARREIFTFVQDCMKYSLRTVLVNHGKGERNPGKAAVLKSYLNKWLPELPDVMAYHSALKMHGGTGAVYVLLRKSEQERQLNREKHGMK